MKWKVWFRWLSDILVVLSVLRLLGAKNFKSFTYTYKSSIRLILAATALYIEAWKYVKEQLIFGKRVGKYFLSKKIRGEKLCASLRTSFGFLVFYFTTKIDFLCLSTVIYVRLVTTLRFRWLNCAWNRRYCRSRSQQGPRSFFTRKKKLYKR